jgi:hypothetical protein
VWVNALGFVRSLKGWDEALVALGAPQTDFSEEIMLDKLHTINLTDHGVPEDSIVLSISYTPQGGGVFPLEFHGNRPLRRVGTSIKVFGVRAGSQETRSRVAIHAVWVEKGSSDGWTYLTHAFEAFCGRQYSRVIVPAQSAVEVSLMPVIRELFRRHASAENVKGFLENSLTFGHAKNVILPLLCAQANVPMLPDAIRGSLNRLRGLRNDIVHEGLEHTAVTGEHAGEGLCAAAFGFEYVRYAGPLLLSRLK